MQQDLQLLRDGHPGRPIGLIPEDVEGIGSTGGDIHFHPAEPRSALAVEWRYSAPLTEPVILEIPVD